MTPATIQWEEGGAARRARWQSEAGLPPPKRVTVVEAITADKAFPLASEGTALLWRGDYHQAKQLLVALAKRIDERAHRGKVKPAENTDPAQAFHLHRQAQAQRARTLGMVLLPVDAGHVVPLPRAPDLKLACTEAYGAAREPYVVTLRELLGVIGAHEWRKKGVPVPALGASVHPHYGVFAPVRGEYVDLVATAPLPPVVATAPADATAFDIGTGTGVLAAVLARRGIGRVVATELDARVLACAADNARRLGLADRIELVNADLYPLGKAPLIVCNPPWLPARPSSALERAVYDEGGRMLKGFLSGLAARLTAQGEGWLILSDLAEHLGLRSRAALLGEFAAAGLIVLDRIDARPSHPRACDSTDALHAARAAEVTSLWRLARAST
ncbi:MAG: class I SAM-dependent methyltransferase [Betaproteobacteria bacterium]|nr:class I SAM-dependent methyltransferase [Betaproteobacteria bacterium]